MPNETLYATVIVETRNDDGSITWGVGRTMVAIVQTAPHGITRQVMWELSMAGFGINVNMRFPNREAAQDAARKYLGIVQKETD